jgi:uncharacterized membrane protein YfcA
MEMDLGLMLTLFAIGFFGSFLSGLVGIGGAIINYPMLLYLPPLLGFTAYTAHEVSGIIATQVFFATLSGVFALRKEKVINVQLVVYMGSAIIIGSFVGGYGGKFFSGDLINVVYALLATLAAILMLLPKKGLDDVALDQVTFHKPTAVLSALAVGIASGIVGAAGSFLLVPILLLVLKIPTRMTIASSLTIAFLSSIGSTAGKVLAGDVLLWPSLIMVIASILAAPIGAKLSTKVDTKLLRGLLVLLILSTAVKMWADILL